MRPLSVLSLFLALLAGAALAAPDRSQEFLEKFRQALAIKAHDEMAKLVNVYEEEAVLRIVETGEQISQRPSDELESLMWALRQAWKSAKKTGFPDQIYEYYSLLDPALKRERTKKRSEYLKALERFKAAEAAKDAPQLQLLSGELEGLARAFEEVGERFWASQGWLLAGESVDERLRGNSADLKRATECYGKGVALRKSLELDDRYARQYQQRYDYLAAQGWVEGGVISGEPPKGGAAGGGAAGEGGAPAGGEAAPGTAAVAPAAAVTAALAFELVPSAEIFERPHFTADDQYPVWSSLYLQGKGTRTRFPSLKDGPDVVRVGSADLRIDKNRDGQTSEDEKIPLTGKFTPVQVTVGRGEEERPWAFVAMTGIEKDVYQGIETYLLPTDEWMLLFVLSAASMVGDLAGTPIRVIDENMDGVYGSEPLTYQYSGITPDRLQPEMDSFVVGSEKRARPWSEYAQVGGRWWQLESLKGGKELKATPVEVRTGTLKLAYSGANKPTWLVVKGSGKLERSYFDLAGAGSKGLSVPVGKYELYWGEIRKGKKRELMKAVILPGTATPRWDVLEGQTTTIELGEPYGFDFRAVREGDELVVLGNTVAVIGKASERYERVWNAVPRPEVTWREAGSKRGSKPEKMDVILDQGALIDKGMASTWFPLDTTYDLRGLDPQKSVEVQLTQKKNPLFGKIESVWR